jgi:hypothetical protein
VLHLSRRKKPPEEKTLSNIEGKKINEKLDKSPGFAGEYAGILLTFA